MTTASDSGAPTFPDVLAFLLYEIVIECSRTGLNVNRLVVTYDLQTVTVGMFFDALQVAEVSF